MYVDSWRDMIFFGFGSKFGYKEFRQQESIGNP